MQIDYRSMSISNFALAQNYIIIKSYGHVMAIYFESVVTSSTTYGTLYAYNSLELKKNKINI